MDIVYTATVEEFSGSDGFLRSGLQPALVDPELESVKVYRSECLRVSAVHSA